MPLPDLLLTVCAVTLIAIGGLDYYRTRKFRLVTILGALGALLLAVLALVSRRRTVPMLPPPVRSQPTEASRVADEQLGTEAERAAADEQRARVAPALLDDEGIAAGLTRHQRKDAP